MSIKETRGKRQWKIEDALWAPLLVVTVTLSGVSCADDVSSGERLETTQHAISVTSMAQLRTMSLTGTYDQTADITMSSTEPLFMPLGSPSNPFRGTFRGNGFKIYNLRIATNGAADTGLFGATEGATLERVRLINVNVSGGSRTGAIVGNMYNTHLYESYVTGTVSGPTSGASVYGVGMAVGVALAYSRVERCYATGTVKGRTESIGGFFGEIVADGVFDANQEGPPVKVAEVFTNVNVNPTITTGTSEIAAGGLVGYVRGAEIRDISTVGNVNGRGAVGGIVGRMNNTNPNSIASMLYQAISRGSVTASGSDPAGPIGIMTGWTPRCVAYYDLSTDPGTPGPTDGGMSCNQGHGSLVLRWPYQDPNDPGNPYSRDCSEIYKNGDYVTEDEVADDKYPLCLLHSGSDTDWGFGTCGFDQVWSLNRDYEYNTLVRIPNPEVQPK